MWWRSHHVVCVDHHAFPPLTICSHHTPSAKKLTFRLCVHPGMVELFDVSTPAVVHPFTVGLTLMCEDWPMVARCAEVHRSLCGTIRE